MPQLALLIKPASSLCNMRCKYCFYADISDSRQVKSYGIMAAETARGVIDRAFSFVGERGGLHIAFQGGEPTVAGLPFFESLAAYAAQKKPAGVDLHFSIQTNGLVIDEAWAKFLKQYGFLVGLSFDGTSELHDFLRPDAAGRPTARRVLETARLLNAQGVDCNILTVVTKQAARHPGKIYRFYKSRGFSFIQFIPCLPPLEKAEDQPYALPPRMYACFLKELFLLWRADLESGEYVSIRLFDNLTRMAAGQSPEQCGLLGFCQPQFVVEADGGVYPCDFYVLDAYRMGSLPQDDIPALLQSPVLQEFLSPTERRGLCTGCPHLPICGGGCKRYRGFYFSQPGYCPYRDFLDECWPGFRLLARRLRL